ncbi:hypothetical protein F2P81_008604 [Scophthalmus maximus]|uniref:Transmembrane protein 211 n=1 Tax=Scophthalmus maximus TaxID=52904 RepID=A0A6A4T262_SCOMX|nr:hypothetical protein F2P81_008604 [Scophthalmus maximus]
MCQSDLWVRAVVNSKHFVADVKFNWNLKVKLTQSPLQLLDKHCKMDCVKGSFNCIPWSAVLTDRILSGFPNPVTSWTVTTQHQGDNLNEENFDDTLKAFCCKEDNLCLVVTITQPLPSSHVFIMAAGLLVYPFGLNSSLVRSFCGDADIYYAGECQIGWGYMLAIVGVMLTVFLPFFAKYAPKEQLSPTPLPTLL